MIVALLRSSIVADRRGRDDAARAAEHDLRRHAPGRCRPAGDARLRGRGRGGRWLRAGSDGRVHPRADVRPRHRRAARFVVDHDGTRRLRRRLHGAHQHRASVVVGGDLRRHRVGRRRARRPGRAGASSATPTCTAIGCTPSCRSSRSRPRSPARCSCPSAVGASGSASRSGRRRRNERAQRSAR